MKVNLMSGKFPVRIRNILREFGGPLHYKEIIEKLNLEGKIIPTNRATIAGIFSTFLKENKVFSKFDKDFRIYGLKEWEEEYNEKMKDFYLKPYTHATNEGMMERLNSIRTELEKIGLNWKDYDYGQE